MKFLRKTKEAMVNEAAERIMQMHPPFLTERQLRHIRDDISLNFDEDGRDAVDGGRQMYVLYAGRNGHYKIRVIWEPYTTKRCTDDLCILAIIDDRRN